MHASRRWLLAVVAAAAVLRLFPIWFGLPHLYARPDEEVAVRKALGVLLRGELNPQFFHWPSLTFYLFAALFGAARIMRRIAGLDPALTGGQHLLLARACVACAGTATVYVLFTIGKRIGGEMTGLIAALFLAVAVLHVRDSHFAMTDVLMTLLVTICLGLVLRAIDAGELRLRWFARAGAAG
ncbi:MAG: glycosyltransferase family 39 protein, partial [Vicinamibacterales bacterium]